MSNLLLDFEGRRLQGVRPFAVFESRGSGWKFRPLDGSSRRTEEQGASGIWPALRHFLKAGRAEYGAAGGAIGYLAYDLARELEPRAFGPSSFRPHAFDSAKPASGPYEETGVPDIRLVFYEALEYSEVPPAPPGFTSKPLEPGPNVRTFDVAGSDEDYRLAVERILTYIAAGDIYQANLTRRFSALLPCSPGELYQRLQALTPMPHAALLEWDDFAVISHSPERFLRVQGNRVTAQPIKGTRPRGADPREDALLREELANSAKDQAENVMIVDLLRNDLGRVCKFGSVEVPELFRVRSFPTVHHGVSTVTGTLRRGCDALDVLQAAFPCGSITGAPKIRAMQIIQELEPVRRGVAMGAAGWIGFDGDCDWNVAIRTVVCSRGQAYFHVGGGIVADSTPAGEAAEIAVKAAAISRALGWKGEETSGN